MRFLALLALAALLTPGASGQSLLSQLGDVHFPLITFQVAWNRLQVTGSDMEIRGSTASDLRQCIDGRDCPDPNVGALSGGDGDGTVTRPEVNAFTQALRDVIGLNAEAKAFKSTVRQLITIDDQAPSRIEFEEFDLRNADRPATSDETIFFTVRLGADFDAVAEEKSHTVKLVRSETALTIADRIVVQAARGWRINADSISPPAEQRLYQGGELSGSQQDFESAEPLAFNIESTQSGPGALGWTLILAALVAAGLAAAWFARRRRLSKL